MELEGLEEDLLLLVADRVLELEEVDLVVLVEPILQPPVKMQRVAGGFLLGVL